MRFRVVALLAALLLLTLLPAGRLRRPLRPQAAAAQPRAHVLAYWTPARMKAARPRDFAFDSVRGFHRDAKPGGGGGGGGTVTGASWPAQRERPDHAGHRSRRASRWAAATGSAPVRSRPTRGRGYSTVLTAGHCVVDSDTGEFATNWMFIPAFDLAPTYTCASATYGCWTATALVARVGSSPRPAPSTTRRVDERLGASSWSAGGGKQVNSTAQLDTTVGGLVRPRRDAGAARARR